MEKCTGNQSYVLFLSGTINLCFVSLCGFFQIIFRFDKYQQFILDRPMNGDMFKIIVLSICYCCQISNEVGMY
jgi:hypothetical protein